MKKDPKKRVVGQVGGGEFLQKTVLLCRLYIVFFSDILIVRDLFHKMNLVQNLVKDEGTMIGAKDDLFLESES